jgi:hypothetical protein
MQRGAVMKIATLLFLSACGDVAARSPDAPSTVPRTATGTFSVESTLDFAPPPTAESSLALFADATDGPDDPSRFVIDAMVARLPEGSVKTVAEAAAPFVAAYVNARLGTAAPRLAPGLAQLDAQLQRIARHLDTIETLAIDATGLATRTVSGVRFDVGTQLAVPFAQVGLPEVATVTRVQLWDGELAIPAHAIALPYAAILRVGLDHAIVPYVAPGTTDLASALAQLADCARIGGLVAEAVGVGAATTYQAACTAGLTAIAADVDARLAAIGDGLHVDASGHATGVDLDGDGAMDAIRDGAWTTQPSSSLALTGATFTGVR